MSKTRSSIASSSTRGVQPCNNNRVANRSDLAVISICNEFTSMVHHLYLDWHRRAMSEQSDDIESGRRLLQTWLAGLLMHSSSSFSTRREIAECLVRYSSLKWILLHYAADIAFGFSCLASQLQDNSVIFAIQDKLLCGALVCFIKWLQHPTIDVCQTVLSSDVRQVTENSELQELLQAKAKQDLLRILSHLHIPRDIASYTSDMEHVLSLSGSIFEKTIQLNKLKKKRDVEDDIDAEGGQSMVKNAILQNDEFVLGNIYCDNEVERGLEPISDTSEYSEVLAPKACDSLHSGSLQLQRFNKMNIK